MLDAFHRSKTAALLSAAAACVLVSLWVTRSSDNWPIGSTLMAVVFFASYYAGKLTGYAEAAATALEYKDAVDRASEKLKETRE